MPLSVAHEPIDRLKVPRFVIFYASIVDGEMWCPVSVQFLLNLKKNSVRYRKKKDCRRVEGLVKETFSATGPEGLIVYVGTRPE